MVYWIKKLQTQLGIKVTGVFDDATLDSVKHIINPSEPIIMLLQDFLNRLNHSFKVKVNGMFDNETKSLLTYFQKEYSYSLGYEMPITAKVDENTWTLIAMYCATPDNVTAIY